MPLPVKGERFWRGAPDSVLSGAFRRVAKRVADCPGSEYRAEGGAIQGGIQPASSGTSTAVSTPFRPMP
ncbi:hypothetical protein DDJ70_31940, partial [Klebsiella michiganensis]